MDFTIDFLPYFTEGILPFIGELLGYFQALGEMPLVYMNAFLRGDNVTWETYNIFTQTTQLTTLYSYGSIVDFLRTVEGNLIIDFVEILLEFVTNLFRPFGDLIYTLLYDYGSFTINVPLWLGLAVAIPRFTLMFFAFKYLLSIFGVRI